MIIDKNGIALDKDRYRWEEIDKIFFKEDLSEEGCDYLSIFLKNEEQVSLMLDGLLDQSITVIANYITKYFKR
jgi:hypothetical protein